jgi:ribosomal protein L5
MTGPLMYRKISDLKGAKKNPQKTYQMKTFCVEQVVVKIVVREATTNQGGVKKIYQCIKKVSIEKKIS